MSPIDKDTGQTQPEQPRESRRRDPDREFFKAYGVGCVVLFIAFLLLTALVTYFWLR